MWGAQSLLEAGALHWGQFGGDAKGVHAVRLQGRGERLWLKGLAVIPIFPKVCRLHGHGVDHGQEVRQGKEIFPLELLSLFGAAQRH